jgi:hypothetical protein
MKKVILIMLVTVLAIAAGACSKGDSGPAGPAGSGVITAQFESQVFPGSGYTGTQDTEISSLNNQSMNYGGCYIMDIGGINTDRALLYFNIDGYIPGNAIVKSAYLTLYSVYVSGTGNDLVSYALTRSFLEGTDDCAGANGTMGATWDMYDGANAWTNAGGDYDTATASSPANADTQGYVYFKLAPSVVQAWLAAPASNYGLLVRQADEVGFKYVEVESRSYMAVCTKPRLTVYFVLP